MTRIVGLTGGIASGKSYVAEVLKEKGIPVIDADLISHQILMDSDPVLTAIRAEFGEQVFTEQGVVDRSKLGAIVFHQDDLRQTLNRITHPEIHRRMQKEEQRYKEQGAPLIVHDVPLLYETHYDRLVDEVVLVVVDEDTQLKRLMARDQIDEAYAKVKINSQLPLLYKATLADVIIDNSGTRAATKAQVEQWLNHLEQKK